MYAYKTWMDMKPNNKVNLNRQGKSYVPFTIQEWVNSVKEANTNAQDSNIQNNVLNNQTQVLPSSMQNVNIRQQDTSNLNYEESAQMYNIDTKNATVRSIYDVANKRGLNVRYDNTIFSDNNQNAIWKVNNDGTREVVLNPNADTNKALQSVMIHELTHDMEGTSEYKVLSDLVLDYSKSLEDYEKSRKDLENMYSKVYDKNSENFESFIDQEVVADVLGEKLGNQEFVDSLVNQNRNVAQKIYDWVISKLNSFTRAIGFNSEYLYWKDVENKFRKSFSKNNSANIMQTKYSVLYDQKGSPIISIDENILDNVPKKDWVKKVKEVFNTKFKDGIDMGFFNIGFNAKSQREYLNSKYTQNIKQFEKEKYKAKLKMTNNLDEIIQNAYNIQNENAKHQNYKSYNRGKIKVKIGEKFYNIDVLTGINSKNKELFYDIVNIEKEPLSSRLSSENIDSGSTNNIISSLKNYVNNESKEKYSIGNNIVDNLNPTSNADIRYSQNSNGQWENFLTNNFKNNGTQETIKDVKLAPTKEDIKNTNKIAPTTKEVQLKNDINNFSKQVDSVKNGTYPKNDMLTLLSQTPKPLLDIDYIINKNSREV